MFDSLLLAVDVNDPDSAKRCTQAAIDMATDRGAKLHVLNVIPDDGMAIVSSSLAEDHKSKAQDAAEEALQAWALASLPDTLTPELHIARGNVYDQIIKVAQALKIDGIFVGAHGPALKDYLIGPNAARVARHATQSVFVIR